MFIKLVDWSNQNYAHLPWRKDRNLYKTLVSEIMLQQTTVGTVLNHFEKFIEKYPTLADLAQIDEQQILIDWKGLGYYRRARNLLSAAKQLCAEYEGEIPLHYESLIKIKGIGDYTANALISIGDNRPALSIDANLERVLARYYGIKAKKGPKLNQEIQKMFQAGTICQDIHQVGARDFNESLMDLGRSICKARSAACELCPLNKSCIARKTGHPLMYPVTEAVDKPEKKNHELHLLRVLVKENSKILVYQKSDDEWLSGQYEVPTFILHSEDPKLTQYPVVDNHSLALLPSFKTAITKYKISNYVLWADKAEVDHLLEGDYHWQDLDGLNLSTASMKALKL